ncbi:uncharacterized protein LOC142488817 [Ascaphus truei]|uniref:uncharacterized protein LOC142488817 n=1 Tax=Ascaphus truei TaxID=8439 RepID=UPI003F5A036D
MESWIPVLLLLAVATVVNSASLAQILWDIKHSKSISKAVDLYNRGTYADSIFKLLKDEQGDTLNGPNGRRQAQFTIKETVCRKSEAQINERCEFKVGGLVKNCTVSINKKETAFSIICDNLTSATNGKRRDNHGCGDRQSNNKGLNLKNGCITQQEEGRGFTPGRTLPSMDDGNGILPEHDSEVMKRDIAGLTKPERDVIILEDGSELILENSNEVPQQEDDRLFIGSGDGPKLTTSKMMPRGRFLGRLLCVECIFDIFSNN